MLLRFFSPDNGQPEGGEAPEAEGKVKASDILNRYGKNEEAALRLAELYAEAQNTLYRLRRTRDTLTRERDDLKAKLPADGAVVLAQADATALEAYRALGTPADLKAAQEARAAAEQRLAQVTRADTIRAAAEAAGFKPSVLTTLIGSLDVTTKPGPDGKPSAVVVKDGAEVALADYAAQEWADFMPALAANPIPQPYDINAGARGNGASPAITDDERKAAQRRYSATF